MTNKAADDTNNEYFELLNYCKVASCLHKSKVPLKVKAFVEEIIPERLSSQLSMLKDTDIEKVIGDIEENKKAYHSFCLKILNIIFKIDSIHVNYINNNAFNLDFLNKIFPINKKIKLQNNIIYECSFIAQNETKRMIFCFDDTDKQTLKNIAEKINDDDNNSFKTICIMITTSDENLKEHRKYENADYWKRGFFISFEELKIAAKEFDSDYYSTIHASFSKRKDLFESDSRASDIKTFTTHVISNKRIGGENSNHYLLHFKSPDIQRIIPGQFVMLNTKPSHNQSIIKLPRVIKSMTDHSLSPDPISYLKRPFGIHRAVYKHFKSGYLGKLNLPKFLSTILHNVYPHEFNIFYKVLKNGTGTKELKKVKTGDEIQAIGSLGKRFNLRILRIRKFEEVHVIGGGVGMAPLVFLAQGLRFFAFKVKAFFGVESIKLLKHLKYQKKQNDYDRSFAEESRDAYIYYEDLLEAGLSENDIFVSFDKESNNNIIKNYTTGFISDYYKKYLHNHYNRKRKTIAFTCGPMRMMEAIYKITSEFDIPLKVFMEKRMACGIGVCLSCVCKTKDNNYSRICVDGPLFDAEVIEW